MSKKQATVINPKNVKKVIHFPTEVIESFNELITENFNGSSATVMQKDVVERIISKNSQIDREEMFKKHWLDVEDVYRKAGWIVKFDQPAYNESYEASFVFEKKKRGSVKKVVKAILEIG